MRSHIPVLLKEVIDNLKLKRNGIFLDGTLGEGGHSLEICKKYDKGIKIIGFDLDKNILTVAQKRLVGCNFKGYVENFRNLDNVVKKADIILLDLGIGTHTLESSGRGFSFLRDEPLLMNYGKSDLTTSDIVNHWSKDNLTLILKVYGEERYAGRIAEEIMKHRPLKTTFDLVKAIALATPKNYQRQRLHYATKTFQALRITVNDELGALKEALVKSMKILNKKGRVAVITFHSLEDRIVKNFFREQAKDKKGNIITKKPITPTREELETNPRARSAKLRIFEKN